MVLLAVRERFVPGKGGLFDAARPVDPVARHLRQVVRGGKWGRYDPRLMLGLGGVDGSTIITRQDDWRHRSALSLVKA